MFRVTIIVFSYAFSGAFRDAQLNVKKRCAEAVQSIRNSF